MPSSKRSKTSRPNSSRASVEDPALAAAIEAAITAMLPEIVKLVVDELGRRDGTARKRGHDRARNGAPTLETIFAAAQRADLDELRALLDLPIKALQMLVVELALDPSRRTRRWKGREHLRDFVTRGVMARVQRQRTLLKTSRSDDPPVRHSRRVDWSTFPFLPDERVVRTTAYLRVIATPRPSADLAIDAGLVDSLRHVVKQRFGVEASPVSGDDRTDIVELAWRDLPASRSRHWMRGCDGSVGYTTTLESPHARGEVALWDVAVDCLRFMRMVADVLVGVALEVRLALQPEHLVAAPGALDPRSRETPPLPDMPLAMRGIDPTSGPRIETVAEFAPAEVEAPFTKLAEMLAHHGRRVFRLRELRTSLLADSLEKLAAAELGWGRIEQSK